MTVLIFSGGRTCLEIVAREDGHVAPRHRDGCHGRGVDLGYASRRVEILVQEVGLVAPRLPLACQGDGLDRARWRWRGDGVEDGVEISVGVDSVNIMEGVALA